MSDIKSCLVDFLKRDAGVTALASQRVYPEAVPMQPRGNADFPRLTLSQTGKDQPRTLQGASRQVTTRLTVECHGFGPRGYADAQALAQALLDATGGVTGGPRLEDFGPDWMGTGDNRVWVKGVRCEDVIAEPPEQAPGANQPRIHAVQVPLVIHWNEVCFA